MQDLLTTILASSRVRFIKDSYFEHGNSAHNTTLCKSYCWWIGAICPWPHHGFRGPGLESVTNWRKADFSHTWLAIICSTHIWHLWRHCITRCVVQLMTLSADRTTSNFVLKALLHGNAIDDSLCPSVPVEIKFSHSIRYTKAEMYGLRSWPSDQGFCLWTPLGVGTQTPMRSCLAIIRNACWYCSHRLSTYHILHLDCTLFTAASTQPLADLAPVLLHQLI